MDKIKINMIDLEKFYLSWCPVYKRTERQHICQKSITPLQVFNSLKL